MELAGIEIIENQACDEIAGNDKENVNTNITATKTKAGVVKYNREDRYGPQAINKGLVFRVAVFCQRRGICSSKPTDGISLL